MQKIQEQFYPLNANAKIFQICYNHKNKLANKNINKNKIWKDVRQ